MTAMSLTTTTMNITTNLSKSNSNNVQGDKDLNNDDDNAHDT